MNYHYKNKKIEEEEDNDNTFVDDNGVVICPAIDQEDNYYNQHPITHEKIIGFKIYITSIGNTMHIGAIP